MIKWDENFCPSYTPEEMLKLGVFEGKYINGIPGIPSEWFKLPKVLKRSDKPDPTVNYYGIKSRQSLSEWKSKGWIDKQDPYGWFEWYIKYFLGRRIPEIDSKQIKRWNSFVARHQAQINFGCNLKDSSCRPKQRQGLLQWAWDSNTLFTDNQKAINYKRIIKLPHPETSSKKFDR